MDDSFLYPYLYVSHDVTNVVRFAYKLNSLRPRPTRRHFANNLFKRIRENENEWISPRISLKFVPDVQINNIPALVQIMTWRRTGAKPLSEPMMVSLPTHICVTRPQWVKENATKTAAYLHQQYVPEYIHIYLYKQLSCVSSVGYSIIS